MNEMSWTPLGPPSLPPLPKPPPMPVGFSGKRDEFFHLVKRGAGLELVTLGFYRFWLTTDIRRHLWSNTQIDGDGAEYTGRGRELLIGFLVALAILVPIYLAYFLAGLEAEHYKAFASIPLVAFFYLFGQFAIFRARRYRLTRTVWRGVRFWMSGSGWIYALAGVAVGPAVDGDPRPGAAMAHGGARALQDAPFILWRSAGEASREAAGSSSSAAGGCGCSRRWRSMIAAVRTLHLRRVQGGRMALVAVRHPVRRRAPGIGIAAQPADRPVLEGGRLDRRAGLVFSVYLAAAAALVASMSGEGIGEFFKSQEFLKSIPLLVLAGIGYLVFALALNVVIRVYLMRDLWVRVLESINIHGIEAAANVSARGELANALGEGFADGLDVAGF